MINFLFKGLRYFYRKLFEYFSNQVAKILFYLNGVKSGKRLKSNGFPLLSIQGNFEIGDNFSINNTRLSNPIGRNYRCIFIVRKFSYLNIGQNVGMSGTTIVCHNKISIGNNVKCGGNVCIYDTDFHSLDSENRQKAETDFINTITNEVIIGNNVFIGAHSTILKGVIIGDNSIIGACSLVSKEIPANEIWGGNPAQFIRTVNHDN